MSEQGTVASRAGGYLAAVVASRVLQFAFFIAVHGTLAAEDRGRFLDVLGFASLAGALMSLGYDAVLVRSLSPGSDPGKAFGTVFVSKGILGAFVWAVCAVLGGLAWGSGPKSALLVILIGSVFAESLLSACLSFLQAAGRFGRINAITVGGSVFQVALGLSVAVAGGGVVAFALTVAATQSARLVWGFLSVPADARRLRFDVGTAARLFRRPRRSACSTCSACCSYGRTCSGRTLGRGCRPGRYGWSAADRTRGRCRWRSGRPISGLRRRGPARGFPRRCTGGPAVLLALALPIAAVGSVFAGDGLAGTVLPA